MAFPSDLEIARGAALKPLEDIRDAHTPGLIAQAVLSGHRLAREVGYVTMAVPSPHLDGATLGLARVHRDGAKIGTVLTAVAADGSTAATVKPTPVYDPERTRVRA